MIQEKGTTAILPRLILMLMAALTALLWMDGSVKKMFLMDCRPAILYAEMDLFKEQRRAITDQQPIMLILQRAAITAKSQMLSHATNSQMPRQLLRPLYARQSVATLRS